MTAARLTDTAINQAKAAVRDRFGAIERNSPRDLNNCVRVAYEWLDAQTKTKRVVHASRDWKHLAENWAGLYLPRFAFEVAAHMHPDVIGAYPRFNISRRLVRPDPTRVETIRNVKPGGFPYGPAGSYHSEEVRAT